MNKKITAAIAAILTLAGAAGSVQLNKPVLTPCYAASPEETLMEKGILEGYPDGELHLERTLTRVEFTKMFSVAFLGEKTKKADVSFSDIDKEHWAFGYISTAVAEGIINGFEDNTFRPDDRITYEQAVKMTVNRIKGYELSSYPADHIAAALDMGIADGISAVSGEDLTRAEAVTLIYNALLYLEEYEAAENEEMSYFTKSRGGGKSPLQVLGGILPNAVTYEKAEAEADGLAAPGGYYNEPVILPDPYSYYFNTEEYNENEENVFKTALTSPLSTFSIDTDTASYSNMRRFVFENGRLPQAGSVRTEELINYFTYNDPLPQDGKPFALSASVHECPWNKDNLLAKISIKGDMPQEINPSNLVFLVDISGSMYDYNKLPLVKRSLKMLLEKLSDTDRISIVTYASGTEVVLENTPVSEKEKIMSALDSLSAGGGTYGEAGINLAYEQAEKHLIDGNNRIILCTDGDFNIGNSSEAELKKLIEEKRDKGIFLTVLGFGMGNYKDNKMETLADNGNGTYAYIDTAREAKKVFIDEMPKTIYTIAKDVKIQVEFNPAKVQKYRLIGYENRVMANEDFENDKKDAGELGAGASVTALYEIVPATGEEENGLKYQQSVLTDSEDMMTVSLRYKDPKGDESKLISLPVSAAHTDEEDTEFCFAAALCEIGMILNDSEYKGTSTFESAQELARAGIGEDALGFRTEFLHIVDLMKYLDK